MNFKTLFTCIFLAMAVALQPVVANAHTTLQKSSPAKGETLKVAPKNFQLEFGKSVKLTQLKLVSNGKEIPLNIDIAAPEAKSFNVNLPQLSPGKYQARWSSISSDGHAMAGSIAFTIEGN